MLTFTLGVSVPKQGMGGLAVALTDTEIRKTKAKASA
jgi:hypothetical protein